MIINLDLYFYLYFSTYWKQQIITKKLIYFRIFADVYTNILYSQISMDKIVRVMNDELHYISYTVF